MDSGAISRLLRATAMTVALLSTSGSSLTQPVLDSEDGLPTSGTPERSNGGLVRDVWDFQAPVLGRPQVLDPFRPPTTRFGAGNRAVELAIGTDEFMVAPGSGVVSFAGSLFGSLALTIDHPNGLRSTLTRLCALQVSEGDSVDAGEIVGSATDTVTISLRAGQAYLNPTQFWSGAVLDPFSRSGRARLIPVPR